LVFVSPDIGFVVRVYRDEECSARQKLDYYQAVNMKISLYSFFLCLRVLVAELLEFFHLTRIKSDEKGIL
jgi:hypothetical protein